MNKTLIENLTYIGSFTVDSGQAMVGDPCYLDNWDTNKNDKWEIEGKEGEYSYQGVSAMTLNNTYGMIDNGSAVAFSTGYGDGIYPVYALMNSDGRTSMIVIDFESNVEGEE
jgi:hypothetical protein